MVVKENPDRKKKTKKTEVQNLTIGNQEDFFKLHEGIHEVEKDARLTVPNPEYKALFQS